MASLNKWTGIGNLGRDPEVRSLNSGSKVVNFTMACSEKYKTKDGEQKETTEWVNVAIFNDRLADVAERFLRKGSKVYIEGPLRTRKWSDKDGNDRYTTEVVLQGFRGELILLDSGKSGDGERSGGQKPAARGGSTGGAGWATQNDLNDEVPFGPEWR